ncbi:hypothetical protein K461DRAFT_291637 [Myriangium duriaei CBS 260.36]|uniref:Uncharacterized protein n=1 Tax=Myriangium duriaei CBS 260.36 TaxID=1168546 RepID=A0A9P4J3E1_9PEZI|nr:hypothetical protein K461DRAFT_291637 [Myriangium duriaei CBS 260.36]
MRHRDLRNWTEYKTVVDQNGSVRRAPVRILVDFTAYMSPVGPGNDVPPYVHNMSDHDLALYQCALDDGYIQKHKLHLYWPDIWDEFDMVLQSRKSLGRAAFEPRNDRISGHGVCELKSHGRKIKLAGEDNERVAKEKLGPVPTHSSSGKKEEIKSRDTLPPSKSKHKYQMAQVRMPSIIHYGGVTKEHRQILYDRDQKNKIDNEVVLHIVQQLKKHDSKKDWREDVNSRPYDNEGLWKIATMEEMWDTEDFQDLVAKNPAFIGTGLSSQKAHRDDTAFSQFPKDCTAEGLSYMWRDDIHSNHVQSDILHTETRTPVEDSFTLQCPTPVAPAFGRTTNNSLSAIGFDAQTSTSTESVATNTLDTPVSTPPHSNEEVTMARPNTVDFSKTELIDPKRINLQPDVTLTTLYGPEATYDSDLEITPEDTEKSKAFIDVKYQNIKSLYRIFDDRTGRLTESGRQIYIQYRKKFTTTRNIKDALEHYKEYEQNEDEDDTRKEVFRKAHFVHQRMAMLEAKPRPAGKRKFSPEESDVE